MSKQEKKKTNWWKIFGIVVIVLFVFYLTFFQNKFLIQEETNPPLPKESRYSLGDTFNASNLLFTLQRVDLQRKRSCYADGLAFCGYYPPEYIQPEFDTLFFTFEVENKGNEVENVSNCGVLIFEDSSQYNLKISQRGYDITNNCQYYEMFPGSKIELVSNFHFSNPENLSSYHYWGSEPLSWENIPGSEIIYFSNQEKGLVKFRIDKIDINLWDLTNETES